jgi:NAD(P)-dependent dehydrogenase (short-subunit alcohol dehydrogenase family)
VFDFTDKTAVVTGASRGIGEACARDLARRGARIALVARGTAAMMEVASELPNDPVVITADLADGDSCVAAAHQALAELGGVDMLVNNAGIGIMQPAVAITPKYLDLQLNLNLRSPILFTSTLGPSLLERRGAVVNVSSVAARGGNPEQAVYAATKGGLDSFTRNLAIAWGPHGVRVNCVAPGPIETEIWARLIETIRGDELKRSLTELIPMGRWGNTYEISSVVCFLCSDQASFVSGQILRADGAMIVG